VGGFQKLSVAQMSAIGKALGFEDDDDHPPQGPGTKMQLVMIPIMVMVNKIDMDPEKNSDRIMYVQLAFVGSVLLNFCTYLYMWIAISTAADTTEIYALPPKTKSMGPADPAQKIFTKTTYMAREKEQCSGKIFETVFGAIISTLISWYFKIPHALIFSILNAPQTLWVDPLFKIYIRGSITDKKKERPFNERYDGEDMRPKSQVKAEAKAKEHAQQQQNNLFDDAMEACWQANEDLDSMYENLMEVVEDVGVDYQKLADGRTIVMQVAGTNLNKTSLMIDTLLAMNPNLELRDNDGWTAIHWACFHGNHVVLTKLLNHNEDMTLKVLNLQDVERMTPLDLTKDQNNPKCTAAVEKYVEDNEIEFQAPEEEEDEEDAQKKEK